MPELSSIYAVCAGAILAYMSLWFVASVLIDRNDIADTAWGLGFVVVTGVAWLQNPRPGLVANLALGLVTIWGLRLAWHIARRNRKKAEDYRYAQWRKDWGEWFYLRSLVQVFLLQGGLLLLVAAPAILAAGQSTATALSPITFAGLIIWLVGFGFESIGDAQLRRFLQRPNHARVMTEGLWRYTRHPNYFGEITQWWGLWLLAFGLAAWPLAIVGPLTITILITLVSGIPLLEARYKTDKDYQDYAKRTSVLIPWPPK